MTDEQIALALMASNLVGLYAHEHTQDGATSLALQYARKLLDEAGQWVYVPGWDPPK